MTARRQSSWRPVKNPMNLILKHGWQFGTDPRRRGGVTLVSRRGSVFEFRANPPMARAYQNFQLTD